MSNWLNGLMGKALTTNQVSLPILIRTLQESTSIDEKKRIVEDLKYQSDYPENIKTLGTAIPTLVQVLNTDRSEAALIKSIIQLLINIMSISVCGRMESNGCHAYIFKGSDHHSIPEHTQEFMNICSFVEDPNNAAVLLSLLEQKDKTIQYFSTKLLTLLLANRSALVEEAVLQSPINLHRLVDLMRLKSEMIRNETLLLLIELTKTNIEIQKILAFEGAFETLLSIIDEEGMSNGDIVVVDCLQLMYHLLKVNVSNQNHFRETGCIHKLVPLLHLDTTDIWVIADDKREILLKALMCISTMLEMKDCKLNQDCFGSNGTLNAIIKLFLYGKSSPILRVSSLQTAVLILKENDSNKEILNDLMFEPTHSSSPSNPSIVVLGDLLGKLLTSSDEELIEAYLEFFIHWLHKNRDTIQQFAKQYASSVVDIMKQPPNPSILSLSALLVGMIMVSCSVVAFHVDKNTLQQSIQSLSSHLLVNIKEEVQMKLSNYNASETEIKSVPQQHMEPIKSSHNNKSTDETHWKSLLEEKDLIIRQLKQQNQDQEMKIKDLEARIESLNAENEELLIALAQVEDEDDEDSLL